MRRVCDVCGGPLPLQTGRGGRRKRHPECSKPRTRARPSPVPLEPRTEREEAASVYETTRRAIDEVGVSADPLASLALALASRIDSGQEPGAALASLSKQLRDTLFVVLERGEADREPDLIEEIRARMRQRST